MVVLVVLLLVVSILAARPVPTAAVTIKVNYYEKTGSMVRTTSIPDGSTIFDDEDEVLAAITTTSGIGVFFSISLTSVGRSNEEKSHTNGGTGY